MKKLAILSLVASLGFADITAYKVDSVNSDSFKNIEESSITLYPQTTLQFNDREAVALNKNEIAQKANVKAIYSDKKIAFQISWEDSTKDIYSGGTDKFADGFAIEFPQESSNPLELPYIGMGSRDRSVVLYLQKAYDSFYEPNGNGDIESQVNRSNRNYFNDSLAKFDEKVQSLSNRDYQRAFVASGFKSTTEIKDKLDFDMQMSYKNGKWIGTFTRELKDEYLNLDSNIFPISIAIWNGDKLNRDGLKKITKWIPVTFDKKEKNQNYADTLNLKVQGDLKAGFNLVSQNCTACHNFGEFNYAPKYMAPNLSNIGGYSNASYLFESILKPSKVVLAGYNQNAHKNYPWYSRVKNQRISQMPSYNFLNNRDVVNMVAYLQTLKAKDNQ